MAFFVEFSMRHERADFLDKLNPCNQMSKMCYRKFPFGVMFDSCCDQQVKYRGQHLATQLISKVAPNESIQTQPQWCVVSARSSFVSPTIHLHFTYTIERGRKRQHQRQHQDGFYWTERNKKTTFSCNKFSILQACK